MKAYANEILLLQLWKEGTSLFIVNQTARLNKHNYTKYIIHLYELGSGVRF